MSQALSPCDSYYRLDAEERVVAWGGLQWRAFAEANGADALARADLRGASLYDFVSGHFTRRFLREFFGRVRHTGEAHERLYRCDSPRARRLMRMIATPGPAGEIIVAHQLVTQCETPAGAAPPERAGRDRIAILRCAFCNQISPVGRRDWRAAEHFAPERARVLHAVCRPCRAGVTNHLVALRGD